MKGLKSKVVFAASGTLNFFGEGWPIHRLYKLLFGKWKVRRLGWFDFTGSTFVSKTTTLLKREDGMPLTDELQPKKMFPDHVRVYFRKGLVLNSVDLSGPGAVDLLMRNKWQNRTKPFMISFMSLGKTLKERLKEAAFFASLLEVSKSEFKAPFGVQINVSCSNTEYSTKSMLKDSLAILEKFQRLSVPIDLKVGVVDAIEAGVEFIKEIEASGLCDWLTCSNTIHWGEMAGQIDWQKLFGSTESPLKHLGGGALSGKPLKPIVLDWLKNVREKGVSMPIKAGGGILCSRDVRDYIDAGATAIEFGSVSILRPWNVQSIIQTGNELLGR
ncbi:hypothetical protein KAJ89_01140 [Candidatus Parcubacteria bacterium]|nr:hypothetical protein [Candidatus Parcubacteria bacterium]